MRRFAGKKTGRTDDNEFWYYKPLEMGVLDLAIAACVYRRVLETGVSTWLDY